MTEKRFTIEKGNGLYCIFDNGELVPVLDGQPICDLLNDLSEENEQLKSTLHYLLNIIQNKCSKYYPKCKDIVRNCFENDSTNSRNDGDVK